MEDISKLEYEPCTYEEETNLEEAVLINEIYGIEKLLKDNQISASKVEKIFKQKFLPILYKFPEYLMNRQINKYSKVYEYLITNKLFTEQLDILSMKFDDKYFLELQLEAEWETENITTLLYIIDEEKQKRVVHYQIEKLQTYKTIYNWIIECADGYGNTVAHYLLRYVPGIQCKESWLKLKNKKGESPLHSLAHSARYLLKSINLVNYRHSFNEDVFFYNFNKEQLLIKDNNGVTVAHVLAKRNALPLNFLAMEEIIYTKDNFGKTVAEYFFDEMYIDMTDNDDIDKIKEIVFEYFRENRMHTIAEYWYENWEDLLICMKISDPYFLE